MRPSAPCWRQVYYGQWRGLEVAVKVMSAEASQRTHIAQEVTLLFAIHAPQPTSHTAMMPRALCAGGPGVGWHRTPQRPQNTQANLSRLCGQPPGLLKIRSMHHQEHHQGHQAPQNNLHGVMLSQFQREVVAMTLLPDHPNVLRLLGACMQPPLMALVTPFCPKCVLPSTAYIPLPGRLQHPSAPSACCPKQPKSPTARETATPLSSWKADQICESVWASRIRTSASPRAGRNTERPPQEMNPHEP